MSKQKKCFSSRGFGFATPFVPACQIDRLRVLHKITHLVNITFVYREGEAGQTGLPGLRKKMARLVSDWHGGVRTTDWQ